MVHGAPPNAICDYARVDDDDLIVMATHGRSGVIRWTLGSVAEKVLHSTRIPLLLVRPAKADSATAAAPIRKILVPLDGSELSQSVLPFTESLANSLGAAVVLMRSVPTLWVAAYPDGFVPTLYDRILRESREAAHRFLTRLAADAQRTGLEVSRVLTVGDPVDQIVKVAEAESAGLIAMSTHGRSGVGRWVMGSVADAVVRRTTRPVLLVRPEAVEREQ